MSIGDQRRELDRRTVLYIATASAASLAIGVSGSSYANAAQQHTLPPQQRAMVTRLAETVSDVPVPFPRFGPPNGDPPPSVTAQGLDTAIARLTTGRLAFAKAGARAMVAAQLLESDVSHLARKVGELAAQSDHQSLLQLRATTGLAIAAVSSHFDPNSNTAADLWLDMSRRLSEKTS